MGLLDRLFGRKGGGSSGSERTVWLGAFGKHPAWDDHAEDIGLETPGLVEVKRSLYVSGIGGNIDTGAWAKLGAEKLLAGFDHDVLWWHGRTVFACRVWASTDAKGRSRYPMVVCAEFRDVSAGSIAQGVWRWLEEAEAGCKAATTPAGVRAAIDSARAGLAADVAGWTRPGEPDDPMQPLIRASSAWGGAEGLARVLYQLQTDLRGFEGGAVDPRRSMHLETGGRHLRLPSVSDRAGDDLLAWLRLLESRFSSPKPSVLLLRPRGAGWVDVVVGAVQPVLLYCLLAGREALAPAQEIPYELDAGALARARAMVGA